MPINLGEFERHELYLNRLASGGINSYVYPSLLDSYNAIRKILQGSDGLTSISELNRITAAISKSIDDNGGWLTMTNESMQPLAVYEAQWQSAFIGSALASEITTPAEKKILSYVTKALMSLESGTRTNAGTWEQFYRANLDSRKKAINSIVRTGYARGETIGAMSKQIRQNFDGILKREAETLARTGFQHYASQANSAMVNDNLDILKEWFYVVTFDNRTSNICQSISTKNAIGNRFKTTDARAPNPPLHFGCRTRRIGVGKDAELTGTRAALDAKASGKEAFEKKDKARRKASQVRYKGKKDLNIFTPKQISANTTYDKWLRGQPDYYIKDTLGAKRFKLFKEGGLSMKSFSDLSGNPLTLDEIIKRHPVIAARVL